MTATSTVDFQSSRNSTNLGSEESFYFSSSENRRTGVVITMIFMVLIYFVLMFVLLEIFAKVIAD